MCTVQNNVSMVYGFVGMTYNQFTFKPKFYQKYKLCDNSTKKVPINLILLQCTYFQDQETLKKSR